MIENGYYGLRLREVLSEIGIDIRPARTASYPASQRIGRCSQRWTRNPGITHLALCHCDTGTGILNPLEGIAVVCRERGVKLVVDAIASYAGVRDQRPGAGCRGRRHFSKQVFRGRPRHRAGAGQTRKPDRQQGVVAPPRCWIFTAQWAWLEEKGFFRTTPPTHVLLALAKAVELHTRPKAA